MIRYDSGTVFTVAADTLVNTVNCVGIMGAGLALEFKKRFPAYFSDYSQKCIRGQIKTGEVDYFAVGGKTIVSFPTKNHYRYNSKIEWVEQGLAHFVSTYAKHGIRVVAFPKLGAGSGNLEWEEVKRIMEEYLAPLPIEVIICLNEQAEQLKLESL